MESPRTFGEGVSARERWPSDAGPAAFQRWYVGRIQISLPSFPTASRQRLIKMTRQEIVLASVVAFLVAGILITFMYFDIRPQSDAFASWSDDATDVVPYASDGIRRKIGFT